MGNTQGGTARRDRSDSGGKRFSEDEYPVQLKIPRSLGNNNSTPSMQYEDTCEYPIVIKWSGAAKHVAISGSWNGWKSKIPLVKSHDDFTTILNLPEGKHEYKYCVDGVWMCDNTQVKTNNGLGGENNVVTIDKGDFEVFDALDKDSQAGGVEQMGNLNSVGPDLAYNQDIPDRKTFEKASHPPVLPPHLLQVILNKDTPISCDPNVLPEPNHVMLNHLYALSIKEGVMVLSATHRYRKKYVTTLLYKPI